MRNIFDSYSKNEDKLTHALFSTLDSDKDLLSIFIRDICGVQDVQNNLRISVQSYPFKHAYAEEQSEAPSRPDAWIYNNDGFALVFEAKITDSLRQDQLDSHQRIAKKQGFENRGFYTITALPNAEDFENWTQITWISIYTWLKKQPQDNIWVKNLTEYFEILETQMCDNRRLNNANITAFAGFPSYEDGYNYFVAKNTIRQATRELRNNGDLIEQLGLAPEAGERGSIKDDKGKGVWDYLLLNEIPNGKNFTNYVHLTLGISETAVEAVITIPDKVIKDQRDKVKDLNEAGFMELCQTILNNMVDILRDNIKAQPILRGQQRRYIQRGNTDPAMDALIEVDLRAAFRNYHGAECPNYHAQWLKAAYDVFCNKIQRTNYEFQIGMSFSYTRCPNIKGENALDLIIASWLACKPLIDLCQLENAD